MSIRGKLSRRGRGQGSRCQPGQVALAWLRHNPVAVAPLVGESKSSHIEDAVASLDIELTDEESDGLEAPYTPRYDFQGVSNDADLARISSRIGITPSER
jgi:aryl-alcohol dehydrogenase-like predicted oxidoreductase